MVDVQSDLRSVEVEKDGLKVDVRKFHDTLKGWSRLDLNGNVLRADGAVWVGMRECWATTTAGLATGVLQRTECERGGIKAID